jgi:hypothetical protein
MSRVTSPRPHLLEFEIFCAATCMVSGKMTSLILPYAKAVMTNLSLEEVSRDFKKYFVIVLVDGVGWHKS